jgi:glucosylglycerate synthase
MGGRGGNRPVRSDTSSGGHSAVESTFALSSDVEAQIAAVGTADVVLAMPTYNHAETLPRVLEAARPGLEKHLPRLPVALVTTDAGSSDGTVGIVREAGLPLVYARHEAPAGERVSVPHHGVPGRNAAVRTVLEIGRRLNARVIVLIEADVVSIEPEWIERLARPILDDGADLVAPVYARHRYDGTITKLLIAPLVSALYGRRLHQPLGSHYAVGGRLGEHLLGQPAGYWSGRDTVDLWMTATAIADGFAVWESWLGPHVVQSRTRTADLPTMIAQTVGSTFVLMDRHADLWQEARGRETLPTAGTPVPAGTDRRDLDLSRLVAAFHLGVKDLLPIWEHILAPDTLGDVLGLGGSEEIGFRFPDDLWARVVYDFAVGHHLSVLHRDHLLRSLVPLYLGRTAAYIQETMLGSAAATETALESVGSAFERQKPYLIDHWTV